MSEAMTDVEADHGGIMERGWVTPDTAIAALRKYYETQLLEAQGVLADIDAGRVRVFHQHGIHVAKDRTRVYP